MSDWNITPKHWYQWINPFWWRRRKLILAILDYQWEHEGMKDKVEKAVKDAILYGEGYINL
jgi:hypothetical protein